MDARTRTGNGKNEKKTCFYLIVCVTIVFVFMEMLLLHKKMIIKPQVQKLDVSRFSNTNDAHTSVQEFLQKYLRRKRLSYTTNHTNSYAHYVEESSPKYLKPNEKVKSNRPSCNALVKGDINAIKEAIIYSAFHEYYARNDYINRTKNCTAFTKTRGYFMKVSAEEKNFPLAYSILMYKDVEQAERLLRAVYRPSNYYCIHVDGKSSKYVRQQMKTIAGCFPNVFLSSTSQNVSWGKISVLKAELTCMEDLLKHPGWKYFINLTGQEFPLKTNLEIVRILNILNGTNSVDANKQKKWRRRWYKAGPPPGGIVAYKGNTHAIVSHDFVKYVLTNPLAIIFTHWLNNTIVPDETFFATLNNNPHLHVPGSIAGRVSTDYNLKPYIARFKNWGLRWGERSFNWTCNGKRLRGICVFGVADIPLLTSRRELFANKFHIYYQTQVYECMERWLRNRTVAEYNGRFTMDYGFYRKLPH